MDIVLNLYLVACVGLGVYHLWYIHTREGFDKVLKLNEHSLMVWLVFLLYVCPFLNLLTLALALWLWVLQITDRTK